MGQPRHKKYKKIGKFCPVPAKPCKCGNNYRTVCANSWAKQGGQYPWQAHHVLCVSNVNGVLAKDKTIKGILRQTEWCINDTTNMYAMPVWGATVKYYVKVARATGLLAPLRLAPPFKNIPQHNIDHNCKLGYRDEVDKKLKKIKGDLKKKPHEAALKSIVALLNGAAKDFKAALRSRGRRSIGGGTHMAWKNAVNDKDPTWYFPFSMALASVAKKMAFPVKKNSDAEWISRIKNLIETR